MAGLDEAAQGRLDRWILSLDPPRWTARYVAWRVLLTAGMVGVVSVTYFSAAQASGGRSLDLSTALDRAIPFLPWTWWIYFPHYVLGLVVTTVALPDPRLVFRAFLAILLGQAISGTVYLLLPSAYPRPPSVGEADWLTTAAVQWFWSVDPPNNTFPSTHVVNACLAFLAAWHQRHPVRWYAAAMALGVVVTVHTAKQHYWIDAVGGIAVALVVFRLALRLWPLEGPAPAAGAAGPRGQAAGGAT